MGLAGSTQFGRTELTYDALLRSANRCANLMHRLAPLLGAFATATSLVTNAVQGH